MHGGAEGSGAPKGNQNALKHGRYTKQAIADRREVERLIRGQQVPGRPCILMLHEFDFGSVYIDTEINA